jgi:hypothetical protein
LFHAHSPALRIAPARGEQLFAPQVRHHAPRTTPTIPSHRSGSSKLPRKSARMTRKLYAPLQANGNGNQVAYLVNVSDAFAEILLAKIGNPASFFTTALVTKKEKKDDEAQKAIEGRTDIGSTQKHWLREKPSTRPRACNSTVAKRRLRRDRPVPKAPSVPFPPGKCKRGANSETQPND